jgi:2-oxoglutarate ferredoxin oxidoreductase subunit delta
VSDARAKRFWRVPLDAADIVRVRGVVRVLEDRCKGCAYCVEFCPRQVLARSKRFNIKGYHPPDLVAPEACTACRYCEILCPEFAIAIRETTYRERRDAC